MSASLYTAEFIFPGHPDKLSDAIADSLVQEAIKREARALVGVEVAVHRSHVYVTGRIGCKGAQEIDVDELVRSTYQRAGYGDGWYPSAHEVQVVSNLCLGPLEEGESEFRELADDQAICIGYANHLEPTNHMPVEQWLVQILTRRLHRLRNDYPELGLGPDGKVMIAVSEDCSTQQHKWSLSAFSCSLQQKTASDEVALHRRVRMALEEVMQSVVHKLPGLSSEVPDQITVNGAGAFEVGGPEGDNGLSGKKLVVDAYGPRIPIGGGAWSGKDFFKADRAGGMHARRLAKAVVQLGLASEAQVVLGWFPGDRSARLLRATGVKGEVLQLDRLTNRFDMSLLKSGTTFANFDLVNLSRWGHFTNVSLPWETSSRL
jgi:S-adenosylmethionine synthetase